MIENKHITIIGLGLLGSSLAKVLKKKFPKLEITGCNRDEKTLDKALELGIINNAFTNASDAVSNADIIVLCIPLGAYKEVTAKIADKMKSGAILTDIGSVKQFTINIVEPIIAGKNISFIPAHPIAGSEKSGIDASFAEIYYGKKLIITPQEGAKQQEVDLIANMWQAAGSNIEILDAQHHDAVYGGVSHLVQIVISSYAITLNRYNATGDSSILFADNTVFSRFTRLAGSNASMWTDICIANRTSITTNLRDFRWRLKTITSDLHDLGNINASVSEARNIRSELNGVHNLILGNHNLIAAKLIASALLTSQDIKNIHYAGTGLRDATCVVSETPITISDVQQEELNNFFQKFADVINQFIAAVKSGDNIKLYELFQESSDYYQKFLKKS
jgi:prephenate dehydrogenase